MRKKVEEFNIVIVGVGGQGLITLLDIISKAALIEGFDVKTSELHGLAQRGGSVEVHIRFGEEIYSPLVRKRGSNLVIALETQETLKACYYASKEKRTIFLVNEFFNPIFGQKNFSSQEILKILEDFSQKTILLKAAEICQKELGTNVVSGIFLLGYAISKKILPLKEKSLILAIKKTIPQAFLDLNLKAFNLPKQKF